MWSPLLLVTPLLAALSLANPLPKAEQTDLPRLIVYFQTTHTQAGEPISMLPLINEKGIALTHLIVCSLHINKDSVIHLNDYPPDNQRFETLWEEAAVLKAAGVKIMGMVGGAAAGSFDYTTLDGPTDTFEHYYGQLRDVIVNFQLQGMDLDVEQRMSQGGISRLVSRLYADFGSDFLITLAPVASELAGGGGLSGFNYTTLEAQNGSAIAFYNAQFYSGFGSMASTSDYNRIISSGWKPADIVAGQLTSPNNGYGYIPYSQLNATIIALRKKYGQIGGIMGWEYFNSEPGETAQPWKWAQIMTQILRPNSVPKLQITRSDAERLQETYAKSWRAAYGEFTSFSQPQPAVDYMKMVTA
ncbi:hypothetical protein PT974_04559 [Cladobotryum mycophilum]|uniref:GH18 domain-containing protein n=1 Tax=Cladobotryum mycophilum TaxID=491253 RepID=A0ABR0SVC9_9HYPO